MYVIYKVKLTEGQRNILFTGTNLSRYPRYTDKEIMRHLALAAYNARDSERRIYYLIFHYNHHSVFEVLYFEM